MTVVLCFLVNHLLYRIFQQSVIRDKNNKPKRNSSGMIQTSKVYSFQDKRLASARNKKAVEIVTVIVALVESTGRKGIPHISVYTIIERCPSLKEAICRYKTDHDKSQLLRRSFSAAWVYLRKYTNLQEKYNIVIPDLSDTPTMSTLGKVYDFPQICWIRDFRWSAPDVSVKCPWSFGDMPPMFRSSAPWQYEKLLFSQDLAVIRGNLIYY